MKYSIPTSKIDALTKIISRYQKKGADITFQIGKKVIEKGTLYINNSAFHTQTIKIIDVECYEVFVEGSYIIDGWQFIGTIEFTPNGNIIRTCNSAYEGLVPEKYKHTARICEHCGKIRNRKDTYLIMNNEGEFKQVGSTCLLEYTRGLDADICASIMSCLDKIIELSDLKIDAESFIGDGFNSTGMSITTDRVRATAIDLIKKYGYSRVFQGKGSAYDLFNALFDDGKLKDVEEASEEEVKEVTDFARLYVNSNNDYMRNASLAWCKPDIEFRDFSLICSFINTYLKDKASKQERLKTVCNEWVGNIGERIIIKVASARCLYVKDNSIYSYYAAPSFIMEIIDGEGHTYKWSASTNEIATGDTITATIKSHEIYKDVKQTVITRGRVNGN